MEDFPTYKQVEDKEKADLKKKHDYYIAKYINMHSDAKMASVMKELKIQLDTGNKYPSTQVFEMPYTEDNARMCLFWNYLSEDIRFLPWKKITDSGWYVEYTIIENSNRDHITGNVHLFPPERNKGFAFSTWIRHNAWGDPC